MSIGLDDLITDSSDTLLKRNMPTMRTDDFDYELPREQIAQTPAVPRHNSRLLILNRTDGSLAHSSFWQIDQYLHPGDLLVLNENPGDSR